MENRRIEESQNRRIVFFLSLIYISMAIYKALRNSVRNKKNVVLIPKHDVIFMLKFNDKNRQARYYNIVYSDCNN